MRRYDPAAMRASLLLALLGLGATAPGCLSLFDFGQGTTESPRFSELTKEGRGALWLELKEVVARHYPLATIDEEDYYLQTRWEEHLGPMYKSGFRRQVNAWVYDSEQGPWFEVQVLTEVNANIKQPLLASEADWEDNGRDNRREHAIIWEVEARVRPLAPPGGAKDPDAEKYRFDPDDVYRDTGPRPPGD